MSQVDNYYLSFLYDQYDDCYVFYEDQVYYGSNFDGHLDACYLFFCVYLDDASYLYNAPYLDDAYFFDDVSYLDNA